MERPMKLKCTVAHSEETPGMYRVVGTLYDGTSFVLKTDVHNVLLNDEITAEQSVVEGWLLVTQQAKQGDLVAVLLPSPTLEFGKNVSVNELSLAPINMSIDSFRTYRK